MKRPHRITRRTVLAALAAVLCVAPAAAADGSHGHGARAAVMPVHKIAGVPAGEHMGQEWVEEVYEVRADDPPPDPCALGGHRRTALTMGPTGKTNTCDIDRRTQLLVYGPSYACSDIEEPPGFGEDEAAQRVCAAAGDYEYVQSLQVSVDGLPPVQFRRPRFEIFTPQMTAEVPENNLYGIPAGTAHLVGHQWVAQVRKLRPGQHTITIDVVTVDFTATSTYILNIMPRPLTGDARRRQPNQRTGPGTTRSSSHRHTLGGRLTAATDRARAHPAEISPLTSNAAAAGLTAERREP